MKVDKTEIPGLLRLTNPKFTDKRGDFMKVFSLAGLPNDLASEFFCETFYSRSNRSVLRGMHFQLPPFAQQKLVYVTEGAIIDVVVDLRKRSPSFGGYVKVNLHAYGESLLIPKGCAHGFLTISDSATVVYNVTSNYSSDHDSGIRWDSFGFDWNGVEDAIISDRDKNFLTLEQFNSPFE